MGGGIGEWLRVEGVSKSVHSTSNVVVQRPWVVILDSGGELREYLSQYTQRVTLLSRDRGCMVVLESGGESRECLSQYTQRVTLLSRDRGCMVVLESG